MLRLERALKKQEEDEFQQALHALETSKAELEYWERLTFSFDQSDMSDNGPSGPPTPRSWNPPGSVPSGSNQPVIPDLVTLARLAASAGLLQGPVTEEHLRMLVNTLQHTAVTAPSHPPHPQSHASHSHLQRQSFTQLQQPQPQHHPQPEVRPPPPSRRQSNPYFEEVWEREHPSNVHAPAPHPNPGFVGHGFHPGYDFDFSQTSHLHAFDVAGHVSPTVPSHAPHASSSSYTLDPVTPTGDDDDDEGSVNAEDKRSRNTAASARFRVKKKQRTMELERSVSDLTSRAEALEREVSELREENRFLKELVLLKTQEAVEGPDNSESGEHSEPEDDPTSKGKSRAK